MRLMSAREITSSSLSNNPVNIYLRGISSVPREYCCWHDRIAGSTFASCQWKYPCTDTLSADQIVQPSSGGGILRERPTYQGQWRKSFVVNKLGERRVRDELGKSILRSRPDACDSIRQALPENGPINSRDTNVQLWYTWACKMPGCPMEIGGQFDPPPMAFTREDSGT